MKKLLKNFSAPGNEFRGMPFWSWNAALEPEKLRSQIRAMKEMGFGGFFMHSRTGLRTPYLGEKWFECIAACIDEAEKLDMQAWLYDEDRWPSGAAGGIVTKDDRFKSRRLKCCNSAVAPEGCTVIVRFRITTDDTGVKALQMERLPEDFSGDGSDIYTFYRELMARSSWYNGETYLDTLNPEAVQRFIAVTHELYYARFPEKFGKSVPGIFSDEPCYIHGDANDCFPWTDALPEKFLQKYGYDLLDHLPELFFDTGCEVSRARKDYYDLISGLFTEAFSGTIGKWCGEHDFIFTGHLLAEDLLSTQSLYIGSAMRFYEHMQLPAVDVLTERWNIFNTLKQCASASRQFNKPQRLTETYACTGWDFPFAGHKALADWQFALGINRRCHHLFWYSMEAEGKRDYPASISPHSPWYKQYRCIEEYFARLTAAISNGKEVRDLLVIHPLESLWAIMIKNPADCGGRKVKPGCKVLDGFNSPRVLEMDAKYTNLTNTLLKANLDFDFGDEEIISRLGSVAGECLKIGAADYKMVLIPELKTIRSTTLALLTAFSGKVFYLGEAPRFVDALPSCEAEKAYERFIRLDESELTAAIAAEFRRVSITDPSGEEIPETLFHLSCHDEENYWSLFIANTSMEFTEDIRNAPLVRDRLRSYDRAKVKLAIPDAAAVNVYEFDLETGRIFAVNSHVDHDMIAFETSLAAVGSRLFILSPEKIPGLEVRQLPVPRSAGRKLPSTQIPYALAESNTLVLDHASCSVDGKKFCDKKYILLLDDDLRAMLGEAPRGGLMMQPWMSINSGREWPSAAVTLTYEFNCMVLPPEDCRLLLEHPELFTVKLNGREVSNTPCGYWMEDVLQALPLPQELFCAGKNILTLETLYDCGQRGLEVIYISGNFGVDGDDTITALPALLNIGDWCSQHLTNYAGNLSYFFDLDEKAEKVLLKFNEWRGTLLGVKVDDAPEILLTSPPYQTVIPGKGKLEIRVYGHRRNALGPFYHNEKWPVRTGPYQYKQYENPVRELVPCGLLEAPEIFEL